jgi:hypothetical protein
LPVNVFLSFKIGDDRGEIESLAKDMQALGGDQRIHVFCSAAMPWSKDWNEEIATELKNADWLILLYTDELKDWGWCLYECGYYIGRRADDPKSIRLCVMRAKGTAGPSPLKVFQSYGADTLSIDKLLKDLYVEPLAPGMEPVNKSLEGTNPWQELNEKIVRIVGDKPETKDFLNELEIHVPSRLASDFKNNAIPADEKTAGGPLPDSARLCHRAVELLRLDDREGGWSWKELWTALTKKGPQGGELFSLKTQERVRDWFSHTVAVLQSVAGGSTRHSLPLLWCPDEEDAGRPAQIVRPALSYYRQNPDRSLTYRIVFVDLPVEVYAGGQQEVVSLGNLLTLARMVRFGALIPAIRAIEELQVSQDRAAIRSKIGELLRNLRAVEIESANKGMTGPLDVIDRFIEKKDKDTAKELIGRFRKGRDALNGYMRSSEAPEFDALLATVQGMLDVNTQFLKMAAPRFLALVSDL